jgi:hypothetical protein
MNENEKPLNKTDRIAASVIAFVILGLCEWSAADTVHSLTDDPSWLLYMVFFFIIAPAAAYGILAILIKALETVVEMMNRKPQA